MRRLDGKPMQRPKLVARTNVKSRLMTRKDAALELGNVSVQTVDRLVKSKKLRRVKVGARSMIVTDSVAAYLNPAE
jgi:hypothetical protein